jgi:hypothetical protein
MRRLRISPGYNSTSVSPARSPKSQIDSSSYEGVSTFCLDVGEPKPRADRRAGGWVYRDREFSVFSSVGTLVHFGSSVTTARFWFQCSYTVGEYSSRLVPLLLTQLSQLSFLCYCVVASDFRKIFPKLVFSYFIRIASVSYKSCWIHVLSSEKRGHEVVLMRDKILLMLPSFFRSEALNVVASQKIVSSSYNNWLART